MTPGKVNLICKQGSTFRKRLEVTDDDDAPIVLTGYSARMQARKKYNSPTALFSITTPTAILIQSNIVFINLTAAQTTLFEPGEYVYDLEIVSPAPESAPDTLIAGKFTVLPEVTK